MRYYTYVKIETPTVEELISDGRFIMTINNVNDPEKHVYIWRGRTWYHDLDYGVVDFVANECEQVV